MITQEQQKQGAELMNTLISRAWESVEFKEQLIQNPVTTIESINGFKMKENVSIIVEDQMDESKIYLNIPAKPDLHDYELSETELSIIAGGDNPIYDLGYYVTDKLIKGIKYILK